MIKEETQKTTIRAARIEAELSQVELSAMAGISRAVLSHMENGLPVRLSSFKAVCLALGLDKKNVEGVCTTYRVGRPFVPRKK